MGVNEESGSLGVRGGWASAILLLLLQISSVAFLLSDVVCQYIRKCRQLYNIQRGDLQRRAASKLTHTHYTQRSDLTSYACARIQNKRRAFPTAGQPTTFERHPKRQLLRVFNPLPCYTKTNIRPTSQRQRFSCYNNSTAKH